MGEPAPPAVEMTDVCKHFDGGLVSALDGLTLRVRRCECVAVTGPSGCGKSTMLHLLAALDRPTSGQIRVGGKDLGHERNLPVCRRDHIGLIFQLHNLLPQLSAVQNIEIAMFGAGRSRAARRARAETLLASVDLDGLESRTPTRLSAGGRQRAASARALANDPELLLADEPTGSLDERSVGRVLELFARLRTERPNLSILLITHDQRVAVSADRIVRLRDGRTLDDEALGPLDGPRAGRVSRS